MLFELILLLVGDFTQSQALNVGSEVVDLHGETELRPLTWLRGNLYVSFHRSAELATQGESYSVSKWVEHLLTRIRDHVRWVKHMLDLRSIDADAVVLHGHLQVNPVVSLGELLTTVLRKIHSHSDVTAGGRELHSVRQKVQNDLLESTAVK